MTDEELREIEVRANAASEGPWVLEDGYGPNCIAISAYPHNSGDVIFTTDGPNFEANCAFVINARLDIPRLIAEIRRLKECMSGATAPPRKFGSTLEEDSVWVAENGDRATVRRVENGWVYYHKSAHDGRSGNESLPINRFSQRFRECIEHPDAKWADVMRAR